MSKIRQTTAEWSDHFRARIKALIDALTARLDTIEGAGYITQETDPTVPTWAKQPTKPSYTAAEVGANPDVGLYIDDAGYLCQRIRSDNNASS